MPTQQAQTVINCAIALAVKYATVKNAMRQNPPLMVLDGTGFIEPHVHDGLDATAELDGLLDAVVGLVEDEGFDLSCFSQ